jgi:hypothetical protein
MWLIQYPVCFPLGEISKRKSPNRQANLHNPLLIIWHPFSANEKCRQRYQLSCSCKKRERKRQLLVMTIKNLRSWQLEITCQVRRCVQNHRRRSRSKIPAKLIIILQPLARRKSRSRKHFLITGVPNFLWRPAGETQRPLIIQVTPSFDWIISRRRFFFIQLCSKGELSHCWCVSQLIASQFRDCFPSPMRGGFINTSGFSEEWAEWGKFIIFRRLRDIMIKI